MSDLPASRTPDAGRMLNVRDLARDVGMQPVDLVRELVADGVAVAQVTARGYRVASADWNDWLARRQQRCAAAFEQRERRADYVRDREGEPPKRRAVFTR